VIMAKLDPREVEVIELTADERAPSSLRYNRCLPGIARRWDPGSSLTWSDLSHPDGARGPIRVCKRV